MYRLLSGFRAIQINRTASHAEDKVGPFSAILILDKVLISSWVFFLRGELITAAHSNWGGTKGPWHRGYLLD